MTIMKLRIIINIRTYLYVEVSLFERQKAAEEGNLSGFSWTVPNSLSYKKVPIRNTYISLMSERKAGGERLHILRYILN